MLWHILRNEDDVDKATTAPFAHDGTGVLVRRLWRDYLHRYWFKLAMALIAMAIYALSASAIPAGVEWINAGFSGGEGRFSPDLRKVMVLGPLLVIALGAVNAVSQYVQTRLTSEASLATLRDLQNAMFERLTMMDMAQLRAENSGQLVSRFTNDMTAMRDMLTRVANGVRNLLTLLGLCAMMVYYDWILFLVILMIYPVIGWPIMKIGKLLRRTSAGAQAQAGEITALVGESVAGARLVKSYQIEPLERARAAAAFEQRFALLKKMAFARGANEPIIFFAGSVALGVVVAIVAARISAGALTTSEFVGFIIALLLLSQPARGLGTLNAVAQEGLAAFERMLDVIDSRPLIVSAPDAGDLLRGPGQIEFANVNFSYSENEPTIEDFTLTIEAGSHVALVGESGAGKSTVISLLPRLYDSDSGTITIDGHDIKSVTLRSLRAQMALVSQSAVIFNVSALENIAFGRPGASRAEIISAAEAAAANDFIAAMPGGFDAPLGEGGSNLSGGQRQRIAIARAFLKDAPILLLDEATSALDAENEAKIQEALSRLTKGRTTLVIAHRLATVKNADNIVVMDKGRIVEKGTHDELMAKNGFYARQAALQFG